MVTLNVEILMAVGVVQVDVADLKIPSITAASRMQWRFQGVFGGPVPPEPHWADIVIA